MHTALLLSLSTPFLKPQNLHLLHANTNSTTTPAACCFKGVSCRKLLPLLAASLPGSYHIRHDPGFKVFAASVPGSTSDNETSLDLSQISQLAALFAIWYLLNIYYNIFNKQVLKVYPFPATVTAFQFGCGTVMVITMWALNIYHKPKLTPTQFAVILPLAVIHTIGNLLTNVSLGKVAVSFTHTIKAMEPFFTVLFASIFLGDRPSLWVLSSLIPIVGGVGLASFTESSFNWTGFCSAMASNITNQSRNVLSKKFMVNKQEALDNINLFSVITIISFVLLASAAILMEGINFSPSYLRSAAKQGVNVRELLVRSLLAGFCLHSYQQVSYMILEMVNPVTHAVGNCVKRVAVIVSSVIFFQTPISPLNSLGTALVLGGVFLYSRATRINPPTPKAS